MRFKKKDPFTMTTVNNSEFSASHNYSRWLNYLLRSSYRLFLGGQQE
jgi:hypothetical protein